MSEENNKKVEDSINSKDLPERYLRDKERTLFLTGDVTQEKISDLIIQLKYLESIDSYSDIHLYIETWGGDAASTFALVNVMRNLKCDIATHALGSAASAGAIILSSGTKGKRWVHQYSTVMIHHIMTAGCGSYTPILDARIESKYTDTLDNIMLEILSKNTGKLKSEIKDSIERSLYLIGKQAVTFGLADKIEY